MMEMQWGGVRRERRVLIFFATKLLVCFTGAPFGCAASNNKPTRSRLAEEYGLHVLPSKAVSLQLKASESDLVGGSGKTSSCVCGLHNVVQRGEQDRKIGQR